MTPRQPAPEITLASIFEAMHPSVHGKIMANIIAMKATHIALFQTQEISMRPGYKVLCIGPECTIKSVDQLFTDTVIGDLPSQRRVPKGWAPAADAAKYVKPWTDPRMLSEKEKLAQSEPADGHYAEAVAAESYVAQFCSVAERPWTQPKKVAAFLAGKTYGGVRALDADGEPTLLFLCERPPDKPQCYYQMPGDAADWYLSGYRPEPGPNGEPAMFTLRRWQVINDPESRPDDHDRHHKIRVAFKIKEL